MLLVSNSILDFQEHFLTNSSWQWLQKVLDDRSPNYLINLKEPQSSTATLGQRKSSNEQDFDIKNRFFEVFQAVRHSLLESKQVEEVGFGWKEVQGEVSDVPAWRVYVSKKCPCSEIGINEKIPGEIAGIPTDVLPIRTCAPLSGTKSVQGAVLTAGATITNLKGVLGQPFMEDGGSGIGVLGFFANLRGEPGERNLVLVSNSHVLLAHGAQKGDLVYQPEFTLKNGQYHFLRDGLNPVAEILGEGFEGNYPYRYPGEPAREYFIDCATARLLGEHTTRIRLLPSPFGRQLKAGFREIARVHEYDVFVGRELRVYKLGRYESSVIGKVVDVMAPAITRDKQRRHNNLLIRTMTRPSSSEPSFATEGDSGALIVDELNRAVGLLWGRSTQNKTEAFASHIHPVLHHLNVMPLPFNLQIHRGENILQKIPHN